MLTGRLWVGTVFGEMTLGRLAIFLRKILFIHPASGHFRARLLYLRAMQFPNQQEFFDEIGKSYKILIALPKNPNADTIGCALALSAFLKKLNKEVDIFCDKHDFENLQFLPGINSIRSQIDFPETFVVSVSTEKTKLDEISYHADPAANKVNIHLKPKAGAFDANDISFGKEKLTADLIIFVDTPSLEHLGDLYARNAESFFNTPKVNIDNHVGNENYANINIVDITCSSTSEILLELLKNYEKNLIDEDIATCLLTGIISSTNSFQHASTTPSSFLRASELIEMGAKQQEIVRHLFKTKNLSMLKLLGRAMARIKSLPQFSAVFSVVTAQDLERSEADQEDIFKAAEEFCKNVAGAKLVFFAVEQQPLALYFCGNPNIKLAELVNYFGGQFVSGTLAKAELSSRKINEIEQVLLDALADLKPRLGL